MLKLSEICKKNENVRKMHVMWNGSLSISKKYPKVEDVTVTEDDDNVYIRVQFDESISTGASAHHYFGIRYTRKLAAYWQKSSYGVFFYRQPDGWWLGKLPKKYTEMAVI